MWGMLSSSNLGQIEICIDNHRCMFMPLHPIRLLYCTLVSKRPVGVVKGDSYAKQVAN
jgi:hypothetical protein